LERIKETNTDKQIKKNKTQEDKRGEAKKKQQKNKKSK
jgi:hypothetical protein